jgi:hypothetical protein
MRLSEASAFVSGTAGDSAGPAFAPPGLRSVPTARAPAQDASTDAIDATAAEDSPPIEWSEEEVVFLHWRLLQEIERLADAATPLEEKLETLRWVFTERQKESMPFSFVSCLRVVGCSPLSPIAYCGLVDAEEIREGIRLCTRRWLYESISRYPGWVRELIAANPGWIEASLQRNPQWINEQIKRVTKEGDLFAGQQEIEG